jgi:hypothetical protein
LANSNDEPRSDLWDKEGRNISYNQALEYLRDKSYRTVGKETVGEYQITTVWEPLHPQIKPDWLFQVTVTDGRMNAILVELPDWLHLTEESAHLGHLSVVLHFVKHGSQCCLMHNTHVTPHKECKKQEEDRA